MLLFSGIVLAMILVLGCQYVDGKQKIVHVSQYSSDDNNSSSSSEGDNSSICCVYGNCTCNSLDLALANLTSNILINITTDVTLSSLIKRSDLDNVLIFGYNNPTVIFRNGGGMHFTFCHKCVIQGITWDGCGTDNIENIENITESRLMLNHSSDILLLNCSFQCSLQQVIVLSKVLGDVFIHHCNFVSNSHYTGHGAVIHYSSNDTTNSHFVFDINNCSFIDNKGAKSIIYIEKSIEYMNNNITFTDSIFHGNEGTCIVLVNQKLHFNGNTLFENNRCNQGAGMYISVNSTVIFGQNSNVLFIYNSADISGGAIFLTNHSSLAFDQNSKANFSKNSATNYGAAIHCLHNSHIKFTGNIVFSKNTADYGGAIHSDENSYISFEGNSTTVFEGNIAEYGGGGAIYSYDHSHIRIFQRKFCFNV